MLISTYDCRTANEICSALLRSIAFVLGAFPLFSFLLFLILNLTDLIGQIRLVLERARTFLCELLSHIQAETKKSFNNLLQFIIIIIIIKLSFITRLNKTNLARKRVT